MTAKTPIRTVFNESNVATGLAEYQTGEFIPVEHGGTGAVTHTANSILLGNTTSAIQSSSIQISGSTLSSSDSSLITIDDGLSISGGLTVSGTISGNVSGTITGNADTATTLETARSIAGQSFDGSADITIAATDLSDTASITLNSATQTLTNKTINSASNTITITESNISDLGSYITASSTDTLTNKTFDVEGTGNSISNIDVADFKSGVVDTDLSTVSASDDTLASAKAIKAYVDQISTSAISEGDSNVTVTDSGTGAITIAADGSTIITMNATTALDASGVTNAIRLPNGTTAQRPSGSVGEIRYNSSTDTIEGYTTAGGWAQLGATTATAENTDDTSTGSATAISTTASVIDQFVTSSFDSAWYLAEIGRAHV